MKVPALVLPIMLMLAACGPSPAPIATAADATTPASPTSAATATPSPTATPALGVGSNFTRPADGMQMLYVPQGEFTMGSDNGPASGRPAHTVDLDAFWMDATEVTNAMYEACVSAGDCKPPLAKSSFQRRTYYGDPQYQAYPVMAVNWDSARAYCEWAGARLPTEAEWEKSARGTDQRVYPWGETPSCKVANTNKCHGDTSAVRSYEDGRSPYGVYDMAGNVSEWTADWYDANYYGASASRNPTGPEDGQLRVVRGGSWYEFPDLATTTSRSKVAPGDSLNYLGFRCALAGPAGLGSEVAVGEGQVASPATEAPMTPGPGGAAGSPPPACDQSDIAYGQSVRDLPTGGEFLGGRWNEFRFCGRKGDVVEIRVSTAVLPLGSQEAKRCLQTSFHIARLEIHDESGEHVLAEAAKLGASAILSGYELPSDGAFRIYVGYGGNGVQCHSATIALSTP